MEILSFYRHSKAQDDKILSEDNKTNDAADTLL